MSGNFFPHVDARGAFTSSDVNERIDERIEAAVKGGTSLVRGWNGLYAEVDGSFSLVEREAAAFRFGTGVPPTGAISPRPTTALAYYVDTANTPELIYNTAGDAVVGVKDNGQYLYRAVAGDFSHTWEPVEGDILFDGTRVIGVDPRTDSVFIYVWIGDGTPAPDTSPALPGVRSVTVYPSPPGVSPSLRGDVDPNGPLGPDSSVPNGAEYARTSTSPTVPARYYRKERDVWVDKTPPLIIERSEGHPLLSNSLTHDPIPNAANTPIGSMFVNKPPFFGHSYSVFGPDRTWSVVKSERSLALSPAAKNFVLFLGGKTADAEYATATGNVGIREDRIDFNVRIAALVTADPVKVGRYGIGLPIHLPLTYSLEVPAVKVTGHGMTVQRKAWNSEASTIPAQAFPVTIRKASSGFAFYDRPMGSVPNTVYLEFELVEAAPAVQISFSIPLLDGTFIDPTMSDPLYVLPSARVAVTPPETVPFYGVVENGAGSGTVTIPDTPGITWYPSWQAGTLGSGEHMLTYTGASNTSVTAESARGYKLTGGTPDAARPWVTRKIYPLTWTVSTSA